MTTLSFVPSATAAPPFSTIVTLDDQSYTLVAMWSLYRGDWYIGLIDQTGTTVVFQPLIGSPPTSNIYLAPGLFLVSTLLYRISTQQFEIGP